MTKRGGQRLVNLTGRSVTLLDWKGPTVTIPDAGAPARYLETLMDAEPDEFGITWITIESSGPVGIPPPREGVLYIVNKPVAMAMAVSGVARNDVVIAHDNVKERSGRYIGARAIAHLV